MMHAVKRRIQGRLPEAAGVVLAVVIGATIWLAWQYEEKIRWVQHTLVVEMSLSRVLATVQDAETSNRGYLITGDEKHLGPYLKAIAEINPALDVIQRLTADNPGQQRALEHLRPIVDDRLARLKEGLDLRHSRGLDAAVQFVQTNLGLELMDQIRATLSEMETTEANLLATRLAEAHRLNTAASVAAVLGIITVFLSVAGWVWNARRDAHELAATMAEREKSEAQIRQMQKMDAVGQLTGGIAHDFNNMLAVIISGLTLTRKRLAAGDTDVLKFVDGAMDGATRAATLTSRLMAFSRQQPLMPKPVDGNKLVGGMSELLQRTLGETIQTETVLSPGLWPALADAAQLENAILNLCVNARDAMPEGGKLTVETANCHFDESYARQHDMAAGQYVLIAVTDTGHGMPRDVAARVFEPFFTTKAAGKGTGLGLAQVYGFVKQSGGHVKIYSEPGHGTTVKIYFPRGDAASAGAGRGTRVARPSPRMSESECARHTILVVEDDDRVRESTVSSLLELGFKVVQANGAEAALSELEVHPETALLFTDIVMPGMNGRKLADEAVRRRPDLKVLFTTGFTRNAIVHHGVLDRGVQFIPKPFTLDQLAEKMRDVFSVDG